MKVYVDWLIRNQLKERERHIKNREEKTIWVTELIGCSQKAEFEQLYPEIYDLVPRLMLGELMHKGVERWLEEEFAAETEVEFEKHINDFTIKGRIDAIANMEIIELKWVADLRDNQPYEHHVMQLKLYMWLANYDEGTILYLSPNRIVEYKVTGKYEDDEVLMLIDSWRSPMWGWECDYCRFYSICNIGKRRR